MIATMKKYLYLFHLLDKLIHLHRFRIGIDVDEKLTKQKYGIKYIADISGQDNLEHAMVNQLPWSSAGGKPLHEYVAALGIRGPEILKGFDHK